MTPTATASCPIARCTRPEISPVPTSSETRSSKARRSHIRSSSARSVTSAAVLARRPLPLGRVLELLDVVVAEPLERAVLRRDEAGGPRGVRVEVLVHGVRRDPHEVALLPLPARWPLGDLPFVRRSEHDVDVPVEVVALALQDVEHLVGHVAMLPRTASRRELLQV